MNMLSTIVEQLQNSSTNQKPITKEEKQSDTKINGKRNIIDIKNNFTDMNNLNNISDSKPIEGNYEVENKIIFSDIKPVIDIKDNFTDIGNINNNSELTVIIGDYKQDNVIEIFDTNPIINSLITPPISPIIQYKTLDIDETKFDKYSLNTPVSIIKEYIESDDYIEPNISTIQGDYKELLDENNFMSLDISQILSNSSQNFFDDVLIDSELPPIKELVNYITLESLDNWNIVKDIGWEIFLPEKVKPIFNDIQQYTWEEYNSNTDKHKIVGDLAKFTETLSSKINTYIDTLWEETYENSSFSNIILNSFGNSYDSEIRPDLELQITAIVDKTNNIKKIINSESKEDVYWNYVIEQVYQPTKPIINKNQFSLTDIPIVNNINKELTWDWYVQKTNAKDIIDAWKNVDYGKLGEDTKNRFFDISRKALIESANYATSSIVKTLGGLSTLATQSPESTIPEISYWASQNTKWQLVKLTQMIPDPIGITPYKRAKSIKTGLSIQSLTSDIRSIIEQPWKLLTSGINPEFNLYKSSTYFNLFNNGFIKFKENNFWPIQRLSSKFLPDFNTIDWMKRYHYKKSLTGFTQDNESFIKDSSLIMHSKISSTYARFFEDFYVDADIYKPFEKFDFNPYNIKDIDLMPLSYVNRVYIKEKEFGQDIIKIVNSTSLTEKKDYTLNSSYLKNSTYIADNKTGWLTIDRFQKMPDETFNIDYLGMFDHCYKDGFGTDFYWTFDISKGPNKHLPGLPFSNYFPIRSYTLDGDALKMQDLTLGNMTISIAQDRVMPTTLSVEIYEGYYREIENWQREYITFVANWGFNGNSGDNMNGSYDVIRILPYDKQCYFVTIRTLLPTGYKVRTQKFAVIPKMKVDYKGTDTKDPISKTLEFSIIGADYSMDNMWYGRFDSVLMVDPDKTGKNYNKS